MEVLPGSRDGKEPFQRASKNRIRVNIA